MYNTQKTNVLNHLRSGKSIAPLEALNLYGSFRLSAIIFDLKKEGHMIKTDIVKGGNGKRFAQYSLGVKEDLFANNLKSC